MGKHRSCPKVGKDFLGNPRALEHIYLGVLGKEESLLGRYCNITYQENTLSETIFQSAHQQVFIETPRTEEPGRIPRGVMPQCCWQDPAPPTFPVLPADSTWRVLMPEPRSLPTRPSGPPPSFLVTLFRKHTSTWHRLSAVTLSWDVSLETAWPVQANMVSGFGQLTMCLCAFLIPSASCFSCQWLFSCLQDKLQTPQQILLRRHVIIGLFPDFWPALLWPLWLPVVFYQAMRSLTSELSTRCPPSN